jgi:hypothetical protein
MQTQAEDRDATYDEDFKRFFSWDLLTFALISRAREPKSRIESHASGAALLLTLGALGYALSVCAMIANHLAASRGTVLSRRDRLPGVPKLFNRTERTGKQRPLKERTNGPDGMEREEPW